ncbi:MAG TPA: adenylate/guanylate cyclase domain-containing protein [Candidatus Binatia bacterium]|nr:adenylate/guanylate cyclase domain-containing protein [Candidatus Binatia bacterium]
MNKEELTAQSLQGRIERKLAAILSADVKGYSRLMGEDEVATIRTLTTYREVMGTLIRQYRGRVVDSPGDNLLAEFASVVDAVQGAVEIQQALKARNADLPVSRRMEFRIGINLGDVIVEGERIYGDGVNIAARLEGLADGGGICISGSVYEQVETKLALTYEYMGEQTVKNISKPVRVYRVREQTDTPPLTKLGEKPLPLPLPDKPSVAVLPFTNMSSDPEQEYFSDGITEDLITDLSKVSGLFIISRNSVFTYKGKAMKVEQVGQELGVRYVLEGSIRKVGNRVRITAQLLDATIGFHVWAERYDRDLQDIFTVQDEVTQQIVAALKVKLTTVERGRLGRQPTTNLEAYDCYLRGLELYAQRTQEANIQARQMFERAIALDPQFATAYAFLGRTYLMELIYQWSQDPQILEQVAVFGQKAVALDDSQPAAHETLALAYLGKKRHAQAITEAQKTIALDPNYADGYVTLADILCFAGQPEPAVALVEQAMRLNPRYPPFYLWSLGHAYRLLGRLEEAITALRTLLSQNPDHLTAHILLAATYCELGREEEARAEATEILRINPNYSLTLVQERVPYKDSAPLDRQLTALRKTGLR